MISLLRVVSVPVIVSLLYTMAPHDGPPLMEGWSRIASVWAALLFGLAALSDIVDGYLARRYHIVTVFGKLFDPLADKVLTFGAMVMLIPMGRMPAWLVVLVLARELAITTLRGVASSEGIVIAADTWGKMKNAFSNSGLFLLIFYYPFFGVQWFYLGWVLLLISVGLGLGSGASYMARFFSQMRQRAVAR